MRGTTKIINEEINNRMVLTKVYKLFKQDEAMLDDNSETRSKISCLLTDFGTLAAVQPPENSRHDLGEVRLHANA